MYSVASEKQSNFQKAHLNPSIITADSNEMHKDKGHNSPNERGKIIILGALLQIVR